MKYPPHETDLDIIKRLTKERDQANADKQRLDWIQKHCGNISATCMRSGKDKTFNVCAYRDTMWTQDFPTVRAAIDATIKAMKGSK